MQYVLTLAAATVENFPVALAGETLSILENCGAENCRLNWLGPAACDFFFEMDASENAVSAVRNFIGDHPLDLISQPAATRRKKLLVADMESTMIREEMLDELAEFKNVRPQIAAITAMAMNGEIDFTAALEERVGLLAGTPIAKLHDLGHTMHLMPGAKMLVATMRRNGATTVLVSGGFTFFTSKLREKLGFDADYGNELEIKGGVLTGHLVPPIRGKEYKVETLQAAAKGKGLQRDDILAVGDGANDIPMLQAAGLGVAYHAKPVVREIIPVHIDHTDLTTLLYAQGYRREEFILPYF